MRILVFGSIFREFLGADFDANQLELDDDYR